MNEKQIEFMIYYIEQYCRFKKCVKEMEDLKHGVPQCLTEIVSSTFYEYLEMFYNPKGIEFIDWFLFECKNEFNNKKDTAKIYTKEHKIININNVTDLINYMENEKEFFYVK